MCRTQEEGEGKEDDEEEQEILDEVVKTTKKGRKKRKESKESRAEILAKARSKLKTNREIKQKKLQLFQQYLDGEVDIDENVLKSSGLEYKRKFVKKAEPVVEEQKEPEKPKQVPYWEMDLSKGLPQNFW